MLSFDLESSRILNDDDHDHDEVSSSRSGSNADDYRGDDNFSSEISRNALRSTRQNRNGAPD